MIKFEDVSFKYNNSKDYILENLNLQINEGEFISIIGKNGTGKSTFLNLISGIVKPTKGNVLIDNIDTKSKKQFIELRKKIGVVFQNPDNQILFPNVYEDMEFALKNLGIDNRKLRIKDALEQVNMEGFEKSDTYELSLGQKQRINIASVLAVKSKYIFLDEPTTMIDSIEKENIYNCFLKLKKEGYTIVFVTNNINEILLSDKIYILNNKQIQYIIPKNEIIENIRILEECNIRIPDILEIILKLKENNINVNLKDWTISEMISEIIRVCKNEEYTYIYCFCSIYTYNLFYR